MDYQMGREFLVQPAVRYTGTRVPPDPFTADGGIYGSQGGGVEVTMRVRRAGDAKKVVPLDSLRNVRVLTTQPTMLLYRLKHVSYADSAWEATTPSDDISNLSEVGDILAFADKCVPAVVLTPREPAPRAAYGDRVSLYMYAGDTDFKDMSVTYPEVGAMESASEQRNARKPLLAERYGEDEPLSYANLMALNPGPEAKRNVTTPNPADYLRERLRGDDEILILRTNSVRLSEALNMPVQFAEAVLARYASDNEAVAAYERRTNGPATTEIVRTLRGARNSFFLEVQYSRSSSR